MKINTVFCMKVLFSVLFMSFGMSVLSMQNKVLADLFASSEDDSKPKIKKSDFSDMFTSTEDMLRFKLLEKKLELVEKMNGGKKDEPKKGYMAILSQEAKKMTETMIKITIWTATIPLVCVVCVTSAGAVLQILARLNAFHGAGEVFWTGASGAFANIMDGITRGWFSNVLGLKNAPVIIPVQQLELDALQNAPQNAGFFGSWFTVKNPENATLLTPYLG